MNHVRAIIRRNTKSKTIWQFHKSRDCFTYWFMDNSKFRAKQSNKQALRTRGIVKVLEQFLI